MATKAAKQEYKRERLLEMIEQRARAAELDPQVVIRVAELESSLRPSAKNRRSTATGLFQLTDARRRELGLPPKKVLSVEEDIEYGVRSLAEARDYLKERLGREPEPFELYAAHFSGPKRSVDVLSAPESTPVDKIYSRVAMRSNPDLKGLTAGQVRGRWQERFGDVGRKPEPVPKKEFVPGPPLTLPEMEREAALQLFAQAPVQEPTAMEPVMMASGGLVGESEEITRLINMARSDADYRRINEMLSGARPAAQFNEGGEAKSEKSAREMLAEMEPTAEELERASKAAFGVVPSSGKGRKAGAVTRALQSGEAQKEAAKGATLLPQNVVGFPVDVAAMLMRPLGYNVEKPVGGSDWLKEKSRQAGVAFPEPTDPTLRAFYTAGDIASNLVNPAGATRTAVKGAEKTGEAAKMLAQAAASDPTVARTVERAIQRVAPAAAPLYAVRPPGGGVSAMGEGVSGKSMGRDLISNMEEWVATGLSGPPGPVDPEKLNAIQNFWQTKATNYITRQFGTPDDPILKQILQGNITTPELEKQFRKYAIEQTKQGKTKVNPVTGEERFFPKYPEAVEDLTRKYDEMTGIRPMVFTSPDILEPGQGYLSSKGYARAAQARTALEDKLIEAGVRPELVNLPTVNMLTTQPETGKLLSTAYDTTVPGQLLQASKFVGPMPTPGRQLTSEALRRAMETGEPIFDIKMQKPLTDILTPQYINEYLATLTPKEIGKTRFEDVVKDSAKFRLKKFEMETLIADIKAGKRVNERFFTEGVSAPLLQIQEGPLAGYAWKRIEESKATVPEGAYLGHSVGGYELGGPTYSSQKRQAFKDGKMQIYTLRDNRNRPVTTVEVRMDDEFSPVVTQVKGQGRATGNTDPGKYGSAVQQFFKDVLKPTSIEEDDKYLTSGLQHYKAQLQYERTRSNTQRHLEELRGLGGV